MSKKTKKKGVCIMSIGISPMAAPVTTARNVNFTGAFAPVNKPDPIKTIKDAANSEFGKTIIKKIKDFVNFIAEKLPVKGIINKVSDAYKKISDSGFIKKGIEFVKGIYDTIVNSETVKKTTQVVSDTIKKTKPVA